MRKLIMLMAAAFVLLADVGSLKASTYQIDLSSIAPYGTLSGPCFCRPDTGPIYSFDAQPGDVFDFGKVTLFAASGGTKGLPDGEVGIDFSFPQFSFGTRNLNGATDGFNCDGSVRSCSLDSFAPVTYNLQYTIPDGSSSITLGWWGIYLYAPPIIAGVPEPTTWALLLVGFGLINLIRRRYGADWNACTADMTGVPVA